MPRRDSAILLASVFVVASCALVYELLAGAAGSYLLGSSVTQFSLVIGIFLSAMGLGSFLTKFLDRDLVARFIEIEIAVGLLGGCSALLLFAAFTYTEVYFAVMVAVTGGVGTLIGLEIPLIIRILREREESLKITVANVMTVDYAGALAASLAFPFLLVPHLGLMRAAFATGLLNLAVGWAGLGFFRKELPHPGRTRAALTLATLTLLAGCVFSTNLVTLLEERIYPDEIIYARQTAHQRIVITQWRNDVRLFLDKNLQFASSDEHRYHEALVHPAMGLIQRRERVLILGGGDGMAAREILKYPEIKRVDLVDIDPEMTRIFRDLPQLAALNNGSLSDKRVSVINEDAMKYLERADAFYDAVFMDLPDPSVLEIGRLYTRGFFILVARRLRPGGALAVQSSSPFFAADAFWCVVNTLKSVPAEHLGAGATLTVRPYHANVPSFGEWGFCLARAGAIDPEAIRLDAATRFLNRETLGALFVFPQDMQPRVTEINRLNTLPIVRYYEKGYKEFYE